MTYRKVENAGASREIYVNDETFEPFLKFRDKYVSIEAINFFDVDFEGSIAILTAEYGAEWTEAFLLHLKETKVDTDSIQKD